MVDQLKDLVRQHPDKRIAVIVGKAHDLLEEKLAGVAPISRLVVNPDGTTSKPNESVKQDTFTIAEHNVRAGRPVSHEQLNRLVLRERLINAVSTANRHIDSALDFLEALTDDQVTAYLNLLEPINSNDQQP
jgi:hypothetical protein